MRMKVTQNKEWQLNIVLQFIFRGGGGGGELRFTFLVLRFFFEF